MAKVWLASTMEGNKRVFYASIDDLSYYRLREAEEDLEVIHFEISEQPNGRRRWRSKRRLIDQPRTLFSGEIKL